MNSFGKVNKETLKELTPPNSDEKFVCPWCLGYTTMTETATLVMNNTSGRLCYWCIHLYTRGYKDKFYARKAKLDGLETTGKIEGDNNGKNL